MTATMDLTFQQGATKVQTLTTSCVVLVSVFKIDVCMYVCVFACGCGYVCLCIYQLLFVRRETRTHTHRHTRTHTHKNTNIYTYIHNIPRQLRG